MSDVLKKPMFEKSKLSVAVSMVLALSGGVLLSGCDGGGDTSTTNAVDSYERVKDARVVVVGVVQDTNGNPIFTSSTDSKGVTTNKGVSVYVAGKTVETDPMTGAFRVEGVEVANVNSQANAAPVSTIPVVVQAPSGEYLGATVTVNPFAQVESGNNGAAANATNNLLLIDGMIASAGVIVLPKLEATVTGYLRNQLTQAPVPQGTSIALDLATVGSLPTTTTEPRPGVAVSWSNGKYATQTVDSSGKFTISNVPSDSTFDLVVGEGWVFDTNFTGVADQGDLQTSPGVAITSSEVLTKSLGNVLVLPAAVTDTVAPYVSRVSNVVTYSGTGPAVQNFAILEPGVDGVAKPIVVVFSEPVTDRGLTDNVLVKRINGTTVTDATVKSANLSTDGTTLTITLNDDQAISASTRIDVLLAVGSFADGNNNLLVTNPVTSAISATNPDADLDNDPDAMIDSVTGSNQYIRVALSTYQQVNTANGALAWGTSPQILEDGSSPQTTTQFESISTAFTNSDDTAPRVISHINAWEDNVAPVGEGDSAARIAALASAIDVALGGGGIITAVDDVARVKFTATGAASYRVRVRNTAGVPQTVGDAGLMVNPGSTVTVKTTADDGGVNTVYTFVDPNTISFILPNTQTLNLQYPNDGSVEMVLAGVRPGWGVSISPVDGFGYEGTPIQLTLKDLVEPTTVLQRSYNAGANATVVSPGVVAFFGEGGELSGGSAGSVRPLLAIGPQLLDNLGTKAGDPIGDDSLQDELSQYNGVPTGGAASYTWPIYDATAWGNSASIGSAANRVRTIGIAFSEDIALSGTPTMTDFTAKATGTTPWQVLNNSSVRETLGTVLEDGTQIGQADLVMMNIDDVFTLANTDGSTALTTPHIIDFRGAVQDLATTPNSSSANSNAVVQVRDRMPPFVTSAYYDGTSVVVTFDEPVVLASGQTFAFDNATFTVDTSFAATFNKANPSGNTTVTLPATSNLWAGGAVTIGGDTNGDGKIDAASDFNQLDRSSVFPLTNKAYSEAAYASLNPPTAAVAHATLDTSTVTDVSAVSWETLGISERLGLTPTPGPLFAAFDAVGPFTVTGTGLAVAAAGAAQIVTYTFSHPLNVAELANVRDAGDDGVVDAAIDNNDVMAVFTVGNAAITVAANGVSLDATGKILTITFTAPVAIVAGDKFTAAVSASGIAADGGAVFRSKFNFAETVNQGAAAAGITADIVAK